MVNQISFRRFTAEDIPPMTAIMTSAFDEDALLFRGVRGGPPGYNDGSFLRQFAVESGADSYCILIDKILSGAVIIFCNPAAHENFLGCIFLDPSLRGQRLGKAVWDLVERMYPDVAVWRTETPLYSKRNLNFYINKLGFMAYHIDDPHSEDAQVQFVKYMNKGV